MASAAKKDLTRALLDQYGQTYADELGIDLAKGTPSPLFRMLCAAHLFSARINAEIAVSAAGALTDAGWTTPRKIAHATWAERTKVLNRSGYARYDERTSTMLGETAELVLDRWKGDLRNLRTEADEDVEREHELLKECKGIGDVGAEVFLREVQVAWPEVAPFADKRAIDAARRLDLGRTAADLARLVPKKDVARLVAALVRVGLDDGYDEVRDAAR